MTFPLTYVAASPVVPHLYAAFAMCNGCHGPICTQIVSRRGKPPQNHPGDLKKGDEFLVVHVYPEPEESAAPDHVPVSAGKAFIQAVESRKAGHFDAAGAMYRKALDVGLKGIDPDLTGKLYNRIEKLAAANKLTPSLKDWAHDIRLDGNDASHDEDSFTKEEAEEMHAFTQLVLTYLFTLPKRIELKGQKTNK